MIVCVCRDIRSSHYATEEELKERIMENDFSCGLCQIQYLNEYPGHTQVLQEQQ